MTYSAIYCALISKRLEQPISKKDGYCECHHIIPKSEGGSDEQYNLVNLTAREHYIAHRLLAKIYNDNKMWFAIYRMIHGNKQVRDVKISSRTYETLRKKYSKYLSEISKTRHHSVDTRRKISIANKGKIVSASTRRKISLNAIGNHRKLGVKLSIEQRRRMSAAQKSSQKCREFLAKHNMEQGFRVIQLTVGGDIINTFRSIREASRETGIHRSQIAYCCKNKQKYNSAGGYLWRFKTKEEE